MSADLASDMAAQELAQAPLLLSVKSGRFGMLCIDGPDDRLSSATLRQLGEPYLVVIAANHGPGRVKCAQLVREWANFSVLHAIAERANDYEMVAELAELHRRVLLVETTTSLAYSWLDFLRRGPTTMGLLAGLVRS